MAIEYAVTEFKYRVLYLCQLATDWEDLLESEWAQEPMWDDLQAFVEGTQLGLQLAFEIQFEMVTCQPAGEKIINETWEELMNLTLDGDGAFDLEPADEMLRMILEDIERAH